MSSAAEVLQSMITPAVLISAAGTLILSTSNRIGKLTERVRELADAGRVPGAASQGFLARQLELLVQRLLLLRSALFALYVAMGGLVATVFVIGISHFVTWSDGWAAVWVGLGGTGLLFLACVQLVREARLATRSTLEEVEHVRRSLAG